MSWTPLTKLADINAANMAGVIPVTACTGMLGAEETIPMRKGLKYYFATKDGSHIGRVLDIDHASPFPVKMEWHTPSGDKRITSFSPDEFIHID